MKPFCSFFIWLVLVCCSSHTELIAQGVTKIRVVNNSSYKLTDISLFSIPFEDLKPKDTSEYKVLNYDYHKHDPLIYSRANNTNLVRYLAIPPENAKKFTYSIDSIHNKVIFISTIQ